MKQILLLLFFFLSLRAYALEPGSKALSKPTTSNQFYTIQQDNELSFFYEYADGSKDSFLRLPLLPNGHIIAPKLGEIPIKGLTHKELIDFLYKSFEAKTELKKPVAIDVLVFRVSNNIAVIGAVQRPGSYSIGDIKTVYDAIAKAGGFADVAAKSRVKVVRQRIDGTRSEHHINFPKEVFKAYEEGSGIGSEYYLVKEGDIVCIPKNRWKQALKFTLGLAQVATIGVVSGVVSTIID